MKILAINTATSCGGVAVIEDETLLGEYILNTKLTYSARLLPSIERMLADLNLNLDTIDAYALALGPGSFTGLRIGLSTFKTLAWICQKPIIGINTLEAMAHCLTPYIAYDICPILDARKGEVFTALFRYEQGQWTKIVDDMAIKPGDFLSRIEKTTIFFGNGAHLYQEIIRTSLGTQALFFDHPSHGINSASVAWLAMKRLKEKKVDDLMTIKPLYLRKSEAEINWAKKSLNK